EMKVSDLRCKRSVSWKTGMKTVERALSLFEIPTNDLQIEDPVSGFFAERIQLKGAFERIDGCRVFAHALSGLTDAPMIRSFEGSALGELLGRFSLTA